MATNCVRWPDVRTGIPCARDARSAGHSQGAGRVGRGEVVALSTSSGDDMQFGIFTVSDITPDPTTGRTPTEAERIKAVLTIAQKAEEVGLDAFALGEHHNPPFFSSSPTTTLAWIAARTQTLQLSTSTTLITTNDPQKNADNK